MLVYNVNKPILKLFPLWLMGLRFTFKSTSFGCLIYCLIYCCLIIYLYLIYGFMNSLLKLMSSSALRTVTVPIQQSSSCSLFCWCKYFRDAFPIFWRAYQSLWGVVRYIIQVDKEMFLRMRLFKTRLHNPLFTLFVNRRALKLNVNSLAVL